MSRGFRETVLVYLSKSITMTDTFLYWETDLLCIFNIVKDMTYDCYNSKLLELDYEVTLYWVTQENSIESSLQNSLPYILLQIVCTSYCTPYSK